MLLGRKKKIPCYVLVYDQTQIIEACLNFLAKSADQLDIIVVENRSKNTPAIEKFIVGLGKAGLIKRYYLFDENITNNAFKIVFEKELGLIKKSPYIILTDGDLTCQDGDWLTEELAIMKKHPEVFACGITLDMSNLPVHVFPDAASWIPPDRAEFEDFYENITGTHLTIHRGKEFYGYLEWKEKNNVPMVDNTLHQYCYDIIGSKWARTKKNTGYHLTWDLYKGKGKGNDYTRAKDKKKHNDIWIHDRVADFKLREY